MTFFEQSVFFGVSVSLVSYGLGVLLQKKCRLALCNLRRRDHRAACDRAHRL